MSNKPTIVLVHGAFTDGASWAPVARLLLDQGHQVAVPPVFLRGLLADATYIRQFVERIDGPVILAGHSYGGGVITIAGAAENVVGLVYVAAYVQDEGESLGELQGRFPDVGLGQHLVFAQYPIEGAEPGAEFSVDPAAFAQIFAEGVASEVTEVLAVSQRPAAAIANDEKAPVAAWKTTPAWGIVSKNDHTLNPDMVRFGYQRGGLQNVLELNSSHLAILAHPEEVAAYIADVVSTLGKHA